MAIGYSGQSVERNTAANDVGASLADFRHASQIFGSNAFANAPKQKFLFHVYFEINPEAYAPDTPEQTNLIGILVREVKLPSYTFTTHQLNQYNRKRIVQTKIKYDPVNFTFHDDMSNTIASMWAAYYTYYYADGSLPAVLFSGNSGTANDACLAPPSGGQRQVSTLTNYQLRTQYVPSSALPNPNNWGYIGDTNVPSSSSNTKTPFFKNITVFGLQRHNFLAYTLINPIITQFGHDTYNYDDGAGVMKNTMTLDYETVVYNEGSLDGAEPGNIVSGFGQEPTYDRKLSPITPKGSQSKVITNQGLGSVTPGGTVNSLRRPSTTNPTPKSGPSTTSYATNANQLDSILSQSGAINAQLQNATENQVAQAGTRNALFSMPGPGTSPGPAGLASAPAIAPDGSGPQLDPINIPPYSFDSDPNSLLAGTGMAGSPQTAGVQVNGVQPYNDGSLGFAPEIPGYNA